MNEPTKSAMRLTARAGLILAAILLTGCANVAGFAATEAAICRELARDFPTWSPDDTRATLEAAARFSDVFEAVCG